MKEAIGRLLGGAYTFPSVAVGNFIAVGQANWYFTLGVGHANLHIEWDLDGDSRYNDLPRYIYINTPYGWQGSLRIRTGEFGVGIVAPDLVKFQGFQFRTGLKDYGLIEAPGFKFAGRIRVDHDNPSLEFYALKEWRKVPIPPIILI